MGYEYRGAGVAKKTEGKKGNRGNKGNRPAAPPREPDSSRTGRSLLQVFAAVMGLAFLLAGVGGFIPGVTSNYDQLELYGTESNAELLGLFRVSILHNIVHLLFAVGLLAAARASWSKLYLLGGGVVYLALVPYGLVVDESSKANFIPLNDADDLLHVGLSSAMILLGLIGLAVERGRSRS